MIIDVDIIRLEIVENSKIKSQDVKIIFQNINLHELQIMQSSRFVQRGFRFSSYSDPHEHHKLHIN